MSLADMHIEFTLFPSQGLKNRGSQMIMKSFIDTIMNPKMKRSVLVTRHMSVSKKDVLLSNQATFNRIPAM